MEVIRVTYDHIWLIRMKAINFFHYSLHNFKYMIQAKSCWSVSETLSDLAQKTSTIFGMF